MAKTDPITYVLLVVDDSGSMNHLADDVRGGFNAYRQSLLDDSEMTYRVTVAVFGERFEHIVETAAPADVPELTMENYRALQHSTALYDAIGWTVEGFRKNVTMRKKDRALLVIQTDGQDNNSKEFTKTGISQMINRMENDKQWSCLFLGAGIDAWAVGGAMGFSHGSTISVGHNSVGTRSTYTALAETSRSYSRGATKDEVQEEVRRTVENV